MADRAITELLKELHAKLEGASELNAKDRALLEQLSADIRAHLAHAPTRTADSHRSVTDRVQGSIASFSGSHPDLTATLARVSKALADMGI